MDRKRRRVSSPPVRSHHQSPSVREHQVPLATGVGVFQDQLLVPDIAHHHETVVARGRELLANGAVAVDGGFEEPAVGLLVAGDELVADDVESELGAGRTTSRHLIGKVGELSVELRSVFRCDRRVAGAHYRDESHGHKKLLHSHFLPFQDALLRLFTMLVAL